MEDISVELNNTSEQLTINELRDFIASNPDSREQKRALAAMMWIEGLPPSKIERILNVSPSFVSKYKLRFIEFGIDGLKLGYKGSKAYLNPEEHKKILEYLNSKSYWNLQEFREYIEDEYNVIFKSLQSYYDLLNEAGISWKKTQKKNPKKDDDLVLKKKKKIEEILEANRDEIEAGKLIVYMIDECHLLWGDVCGYVWGKTDIRIEVPMTNMRKRQTYFGALNYLTKQFFVEEYESGNSENTILFLKFLQSLHPGTRMLIIWDGASYHKYGEMPEYLREVNQALEESDWVITCELFAPHAPEQNPVEDIWLQAKRFLREYWYLCVTFPAIRELFMLVTHYQFFKFSKLDLYGTFAQKSELLPA
jgi:putative transposase